MAIRALSRALKYEPDTTQYQNMLAEAYIKWGRANRAKHILKNVKYPNFRTTQLWENIYRSPPLRVYPVLPAPKSWSKSRSAP
jgi:predicted Zn-dependent protease